jgi:hypothetical protein
VHILSTDSDELGDTTRHFIIYGEFIFKYLGQSTSSIGTKSESLYRLYTGTTYKP